MKLNTSIKQSSNFLGVAIFIFLGLLLLIPYEGVFALCTLEGNVRIDDPGSGVDTTEIACCAHIVLLDSTREVIQSVCLDVNFDYSFTSLPDGVYTVRVMCAKRDKHFLYTAPI